ncbi:hypothetical protein HDU76_006669 [Blyttiomyces sp. JEL0837]|nr:hypothetical protein HDU76_006669 [Blyttiomyces sp. JEL0837]
MKVFITGASGFIGQTLTKQSLQNNDTVIALSRSSKSDSLLTSYITSHDPTLLPNLIIIRGDLDSIEAMHDAMRDCAIVYHIAAKVESQGTLEDFRRVNVEGTKNVLEAARKCGVGRFLYCSTEGVCVRRDGGPVVMVDEDCVVDPPEWARYSFTKKEAEDLVLVENLCSGFRLAATKGQPGGIYFLTDGEPVPFEDLLRKFIATVPGVQVPESTVPFSLLYTIATIIENIPFFGFGTSRPALITRQELLLVGQELTVSDAKARRELGYAPHVTMEAGLLEMAQAS